eukprot:14642676-Alexandrium_andersonii.AAC.1
MLYAKHAPKRPLPLLLDLPSLCWIAGPLSVWKSSARSQCGACVCMRGHSPPLATAIFVKRASPCRGRRRSGSSGGGDRRSPEGEPGGRPLWGSDLQRPPKRL